jgi:D-serine deaminase-like pyridoxal phosphate-dependent protein
MSKRRIQDLDTPALLLDLPTMESNLRRMAKFISDGRAVLRPHFKNHQSVWLCQKQLEAGAIGITCATLAQAELLASHGVKSILIASEITNAGKINQLAELSRQGDVIVALDNTHVATDMGRISRNKKTSLNVLIDLNIGQNRCGVDPGEPALSLAKAALQQGLIVRGVMGYEGHLTLTTPGPEKEKACRAALDLAVNTKHLLEQNDIACEIVSAGSTGTHLITARHPGITELQAGTYLTMDGSYQPFAADYSPALSLLVSVISKTECKRFVIDAGRKALSGERGLPMVKNIEGVRLVALHSEHAIVEIQDPTVAVDVGDSIEIWVQYSDPSVRLHQRMYGVRGDSVEEEWSIGR